ncbi:MAG: hypothetical protein KatS3mg002_1101 [Candidatus Woesearchaeota archaeon]|nr:MAG: hypothetical protein KatS3mg002_1101 [Candidatus Woesearchaeota archaeon]
MNNKAQAALEFLMTYGWAILVVLAAIGALAYFGVLSPTNFLPDQCTATSGIGCLGKPLISTNSVSFTLTNGLGQTINLASANTSLPASGNISFCQKGDTTCTNTTYPWADGQDVTVRYVQTGGIPTTSFKGTFQFNYTNAMSGLPESITVQIAGKVK